MVSITIRNLHDDLKRRLCIRAAEHGRSMEAEARDILRRAIGDAPKPRNLAHSIRSRVAARVGSSLISRLASRCVHRIARPRRGSARDNSATNNLLKIDFNKLVAARRLEEFFNLIHGYNSVTMQRELYP